MGGTREHKGQHRIKRAGDVIYGADREIGAWLATRIPGYEPSQGMRGIGIIKKGVGLAAGVAYERFNGVHIEASIAAVPGARWASRSNLFHMFWYPFGTLGVKAITVTVSSSNLESLNLATKLGFEPEALVRFAAQDGSTLVVLKMYPEQCRWISHGGQIEQFSAEST